MSSESPQKKSVKLKRLAGLIVPIALIALALHILHKHLAGVTWETLRAAFAAIDRHNVRLSLLATAISFIGLAAYDIFAVRVAARGRISLWSAAFAGLTGSAVSNTLGFHLLTGGAVRYRLFRRWGMELGDVSRITALSMAGIGLGYVSIITVALFFNPLNPKVFPPLMVAGSAYLGVAMIFAVGGFFWWLAHHPRRVTIKGWLLPFPNATSAMQQMAVAFIEMGAAIMALYVLVPPDLAPRLPAFAIIYIGALWIGVLSHAPGGVGVFEAGIMASLAAAGRSDMIAALLVYRAVYNLMPFVLGLTALGLREVWYRFFNSTAGKV